jgi:phosphotriesterase-related protein
MTRLSRSDLKGRSQTVLGLIDPAQLGSTLMHEHIICDITPPKLAATGVEGDEIDICNCWQINYGQKTSALKYKLNQADIATREKRWLRPAAAPSSS